MVTGYGLADRIARVLFASATLLHRAQTGSGFHPVSYRIDGTRACLPGAKAARGEVKHLFPLSTGAKNVRSHTFRSRYFFMAWCLIKHKN
jgi:hypothetical protein